MLLISSIRLAERTTENRGYLAHFIRLKYTVGHEFEMRIYFQFGTDPLSEALLVVRSGLKTSEICLMTCGIDSDSAVGIEQDQVS
jgi:hypothetical protein